MGHLNGILARVVGNLNNNFQKSQMPGGLPGEGGGGGVMFKLRFDRYVSKKIVFFRYLSFGWYILKSSLLLHVLENIKYKTTKKKNSVNRHFIFPCTLVR